MMKEREDFFSINQKIRSKVIVDKKKIHLQFLDHFGSHYCKLSWKK